MWQVWTCGVIGHDIFKCRFYKACSEEKQGRSPSKKPVQNYRAVTKVNEKIATLGQISLDQAMITKRKKKSGRGKE